MSYIECANLDIERMKEWVNSCFMTTERSPFSPKITILHQCV